MEKAIKILLLENDPDIFRQLLSELKKSDLNYTTEVVQSRQEYEKALGSLFPDIILSDYTLSSFNWLSAFKIRQQVSPETPFIIVSGTIGEENVVELIKMGMTDYVLREKLYLLVPKIQRALQQTADRRQKEQAECQLRRREQQLRQIMDLSLDVICTLDQDGRFVTIGAASKVAWGYLPQDLLGCKALDLIHPEDRDRTVQAIMELKNARDLINFENRFIRKDGRTITLLWSAHWNPEERLRYCVARDATELRKAHEKIKNSEKRFRTLLQNSSDGFSLSAADGTVLERSPSSLKILGFDAGEAPAKLRYDLFHPDDLPAAKEAYLEVKHAPNHKRTVECRFLMPDGSYKWLEVTLHNQLQEPAVAAMVSNYRDITENKHAEIALRTSEARLKQAQTIGQMGNWEMDWTNGHTVWSDEMYRIVGADKKQIRPSMEAFLSFIHPEDRPGVLARIEKANFYLENGSNSFRLLRPNGQVRYVTAEWRFEFDDQGKPARLFGILQDGTDRKMAEIALEESEKKYRNLFNLSPTPMWVYDVETFDFLDVNEAAIQHYGYSKKEFLAMSLPHIWPTQDQERLMNLAASHKTADTHNRYTSRHVKKNKELIDVEVRANLIELEGRQAKLVIATDISERSRYISAIEAQNQRFREIAWTQSHVVRAPLARMMGLVSLLKNYPADKMNDTNILNLISDSAHELDGIIRKIVRKAEQVDNPAAMGE